jgi:hypothetical protein
MTFAFDKEYISSIARLQSPWLREGKWGETSGSSYESSSRGEVGVGDVEGGLEMEVEEEGGEAAAEEDGETEAEVDDDEEGGGRGARRGCINALDKTKGGSGIIDRIPPSSPSSFASPTMMVSS